MPSRDPDPTPTYRRFLAMLHATGRERGDGFDGSHFDGLAEHERPLVRAALHDLMRRGDTGVPDSYFAFDPGGAPDQVARWLAEYPFPHPAGLSCAVALWRRGRDPRHASAMLPYAVHPSPHERMLVFYHLSDAPCTPAVRRAAAVRLRDEHDDLARHYAAKTLLRCLGLVAPGENPYDRHRAWVEALTSADPFRRRGALARVLDADPALREAVLAE